MIAQRPIKRNEAQSFHRALRKQEAVERITGRRFRINRPHRVAMVDNKEVQPDLLKVVRQIVKGETGIDFSEASLDCDFP